MLEPNTNVVINSKMKAFVFKLSKDGEIIYNLYNSSLKPLGSHNFDEKGVKIYSVSIDTEDIIHLVALINTGELNYYKYIDEKWSKATIANFDLKSNIYNQMEILIVDGKLNIIYNYSNLINSNIWTIQHVIYNKKIEEKYNAIRYVSKKTPDTFFIDVDSLGTIHLLYKTDLSGLSQIYHIFYSPYTKIWTSVPKQISLDNIKNLNPFLFIDSHDNLHGLLLEELNDGYKIKYLRMSSSGKEKYIWKEIKLPYISISNFPPIIFEENNKLKLLYVYDSSIKHLYSPDYGISWSEAHDKDNRDENTSIIRIPSNLSSINHKIKHSYCNVFESPKISFLDIYPKKADSSEELVTETINEEIVEEIVEDKVEDNIITLTEIDSKIDQILKNYITSESLASMIISNQVNIANKLDDIQKSLDSNKQSFFTRLFNSPK